MITFKQSTIIHAPVEKVFAFISDPHQIPRWRTDVPGVSAVGKATETGTTFLEEVKATGKKHLLMKVTEYSLNKKLVIEAQRGMPILPTQSFTFSPENNGTRIDLSVSVKVSGLLRLLQFRLPSQLKNRWSIYFDNLNHVMSKEGRN